MQIALATKAGAASKAARILNVPIVEAAPFSYAIGTVEWLVDQLVSIELTVLEWSNLPFHARIAKVVVNEMEVIVACEGAVPVDLEDSRWMPRKGVHEFDLELDESGGSVLTCGAPVSPGALEILRAIVAHAQNEFRAAVDDRNNDW